MTSKDGKGEEQTNRNLGRRDIKEAGERQGETGGDRGRVGTRGGCSAKMKAIIIEYQLLLAHHKSIATKTNLFSTQKNAP